MFFFFSTFQQGFSVNSYLSVSETTWNHDNKYIIYEYDFCSRIVWNWCGTMTTTISKNIKIKFGNKYKIIYLSIFIIILYKCVCCERKVKKKNSAQIILIKRILLLQVIKKISTK